MAAFCPQTQAQAAGMTLAGGLLLNLAGHNDLAVSQIGLGVDDLTLLARIQDGLDSLSSFRFCH
jgi:hypothetical protein